MLFFFIINQNHKNQWKKSYAYLKNFVKCTQIFLLQEKNTGTNEIPNFFKGTRKERVTAV